MTTDPCAGPDDVERAVALARQLVADAAPTWAERRRAARLARLVADPGARRFTLGLTDELLRIDDPVRAGARLRSLRRSLQGSTAIGPLDRAALMLGSAVVGVAPRPVLALVGWRVRREAGPIIGPADGDALTRRLRRHRRRGFLVNVNLLGEAVLGEDEALARLAAIEQLADHPDVTHLSVKASAILSQINLLAFDATVEALAERFARLFRRAASAQPPVLVNVDMEERRDLRVTVAGFTRALGEPDLLDYGAGIALQAYLPESAAVLDELITWAAARASRGGAPIKVRIVKGANLAMERVDAELHAWPEVTCPTKAATDAAFRRLLGRLLDPATEGMRVGVASHNIFDVALAHGLAVRLGTRDRLDLEMLDGMANPQARAVRARLGPVLLYTPVVARGDFNSAVAYLARRLDENSAPDNFLRHALGGDPGWFDVEAERFRASFRPGSRSVATAAAVEADHADDRFRNEPDTDLADDASRHAILAAVAVRRREPRVSTAIPDASTVRAAWAVARRAGPRWEGMGPVERRRLLDRVATLMAAERASTIAAMVCQTHKTVVEADPEVSEAIDFARFYGRAAVAMEAWGPSTPRGVVVIAPPWNFPYAIPAGGVFAALAAGNTVILKPAPEAVGPAQVLVDQCRRAGVPADVLQLLPCRDDEVGRLVVAGEGSDVVILTGAHDTAMQFRRWRPDLHLLAETSGKNAMVITETADLDLAIRDLVRSAFGHSGQKCSAASLAIVEAGVYDRPEFGRRLVDAVASLRVGPAWDPRTVVGPLIGPPGGALLRALTELGEGERWLLRPMPDPDDPALWSPGIRAGVRPGSEFHLVECFGPVLGLMRARDLLHAIELQNAPSFGLTGGLHSLGSDEVAIWTERVQVGNAYVNRTTTGAVVRRQPFGGWKRSVVGPTAKAGGPNYLAALRHWPGPPIGSRPVDWDAEWEQLRSEVADPSDLRCEANGLRYVPREPMWLRVGPDTPEGSAETALAAAAAVGVDVRVSRGESDDAFIEHLRGDPRPVRAVGAVEDGLRRAALALLVEVDDTPVAGSARVELLRWVREQAVSITRHRHGIVDPSIERRGSAPG